MSRNTGMQRRAHALVLRERRGDARGPATQGGVRRMATDRVRIRSSVRGIDETKAALLTTEFWAMVLLIVVVLIAAAISDSLDDVRAWTLVTIIGAAYI